MTRWSKQQLTARPEGNKPALADTLSGYEGELR